MPVVPAQEAVLAHELPPEVKGHAEVAAAVALPGRVGVGGFQLEQLVPGVFLTSNVLKSTLCVGEVCVPMGG